MNTRLLLTIVELVLFTTFFVSTFGCENMNGERSVSGKLPLEEKTVKAEQIADSLALPEGTSYLETRIISKTDLGVVAKKFSTIYHCDEIDLSFHDVLVSNGWKYLRTERKGLFGLDIYSSFSRDEFKIEVLCGELKNFRGIRTFYITCFW